MKLFSVLVAVAVGADLASFCTPNATQITHMVHVARFGFGDGANPTIGQVDACKKNSRAPVYGGFQLEVDGDGVFPPANWVFGYLKKDNYWDPSYDGANLFLGKVSLANLKHFVSNWTVGRLTLTMKARQWEEFGDFVNGREDLFSKVYLHVKHTRVLSRVLDATPPEIEVSIITQPNVSKRPKWVNGYTECADLAGHQICRDFNYKHVRL